MTTDKRLARCLAVWMRLLLDGGCHVREHNDDLLAEFEAGLERLSR
jgi:hypothetical protein